MRTETGTSSESEYWMDMSGCILSRALFGGMQFKDRITLNNTETYTYKAPRNLTANTTPANQSDPDVDL